MHRKLKLNLNLTTQEYGKRINLARKGRTMDFSIEAKRKMPHHGGMGL